MEGKAATRFHIAVFLDSTQGALCVAYGYRIGEVMLPEVKPPKQKTVISRVTRSPDHHRPVAVSLGPVVTVAALPHPDQYDTATTLAGILKRAASKHPEPDAQVLEQFGLFVQEWLEANLTPLAPDADVSVERWLEHCNYPAWRKQELLAKYAEVVNEFGEEHAFAKCFIKDETYPDYKHARGIYSRSDEFKCFVGPFFKLIEEEVYKRPEFIKHIPVADRPRYILDLLGGEGASEATDYTAFESQFRREIMQSCEIAMYKYMTQCLPDKERFYRHLEVIMSRQKCKFRFVDAELDTCRLSGEMCTSLGNGFSNLMFALFTAHRKGCSNVRIVVEGDDGLMKHDGPALSTEDFVPLGLTIKIDHHERIETASFCGIIFDTEELINIDDPRDVLATFGWGTSQYTGANKNKKLRLLRCKALSLAHQYPGCPIISELAHYGLRVTRSQNIEHVGKNTRNQWYRTQLLAAMSDEKKILKREPGPRSRALVEQMYGISIEAQLAIEFYLANKQDDGPLSCEWITSIMPEVWREYSQTFVRYIDLKNQNNEIFTNDGIDHLSSLLNLPGVIVTDSVTRALSDPQPIVQGDEGRHRA